MEELIKAMSNEDLVALKLKYKDNASVTTLIDGILATRGREEAEAKAKVRFATDIGKLFAKLPHPEDVHNVYARWAEVEEAIGEPEPVEIVGADGVKRTEMRQPTARHMAWVVETNKGFTVGKASGSIGKVVAHRLAITISKRSETNASQLVLVGNFPSGQKGAEFLHIPTGVESANKVLRDRGYFVEPYTGTDYTS